MTTSSSPFASAGGYTARLNRELATAIPGMERPDLGDLGRARQVMSSEGLPIESAETNYGALVDLETCDVAVGDGRVVHTRIYRPKGNFGPRPAVLLLHGGGFVGGDVAAEHARGLRFAAEAGCVVISPDYALAPEMPYPQALNDCVAVFAWIFDMSSTLGIDPVRVTLAGVSAGGALAAGTALRARDSGGPEARAMMLLFPVLDDRLATGSMRDFDDTPVWDSRNSRAMWRQYLGGSEPDGYAAPARADSVVNLPRTYMAIAELDPLRDEALEFADRLLSEHVAVDVRLWAGAYHVFDQLMPDAELSKRSLHDQVAFLIDVATE